MPFASRTALALLALLAAAPDAGARVVDCRYSLRGPMKNRKTHYRGRADFREFALVPDEEITPGRIQEILQETKERFRAAGVKYREVEVEIEKKGKTPALRILPDKGGHSLNRFAWSLDRSIEGTHVVFSPANLSEADAFGLYDIDHNVLFVSSDSVTDLLIDQTDLHEATHWYHGWLYRNGIESLFHAEAESTKGPISRAGNRANYDKYMNFEEGTTFALDLRTGVTRLAAAAQDAKGTGLDLVDAFKKEMKYYLETVVQQGAIIEQSDEVVAAAQEMLKSSPDDVALTSIKILGTDVHQLEWTLDAGKDLKFRLYLAIREGDTRESVLARAGERLGAMRALYTDMSAMIEKIPVDDLRSLKEWTPKTEKKLIDLTSRLRRRAVQGHRLPKS